MTRWHLTCDRCDASVWTGARGEAFDAWCEACQRPAGVASRADAVCPGCGAPLTLGAPRFEELYGELQQLEAVLGAWAGDAAPLARLLPERPVFLTDLDPPEPAPGDPPVLAGALERLAAGEFTAARAGLESAPERVAASAR
ncbi:MAG TPA: hypothetical protein VFK69_14020, partial [Candidatus Eisenbacteria bacterium]|nr:hypothetical protein [Candidatus Eisenbacteria bacterium]